MQDLKIWIFSLIAASLICSIVDFLLPAKKQKIPHIILNIFLILCILSPLKKIKFNEIMPNLNTNEKIEKQIGLNIEKITKINVKKIIEKEIETMGAKVKSLDIYIEDSQTIVCKIFLLSGQENAEKIRKNIEDKFKNCTHRIKILFQN
jgi:hypothetical protein